MKTIREYAEEYLQDKAKQTIRLVTEHIIASYGDRYFDESFYNEGMTLLKKLEATPSRIDNYWGIGINVDDPTDVRYHQYVVRKDGVCAGNYILFNFTEDNRSQELGSNISITIPNRAQWRAVILFSKEKWALKLMNDSLAYIEEKKVEAKRDYNEQISKFKALTLERVKDFYEERRAAILEERKRKEEERRAYLAKEDEKKKQYGSLQARAQAVIDSLNTIFAEVNAIERDCKDVPDGAWDEQLPKWHKVVTAKAREIAALSITHERLKDQAEYFASLDGEWQIEAEPDEEILGF